jgi:hypothetical protein
VYGGSSAELAEVRTWSVETTTCTITIERTNTFFPGDVNEPMRELEDMVVQGRRRDGAASVRIRATLEAADMSIFVEASRAERDRIHATFWRAFGLTYEPEA